MKLKGKHFSSSYPVGRVGPAECEVSKPTRTKTLLMLGEIVVGWEGVEMGGGVFMLVPKRLLSEALLW